MNKAPLLALALLVIGCVAEAGPPSSSAPIAFHGASPARFQQFCEQTWSVPQANEIAAARGNEGWELVAMFNGVLCFKRPVPGRAPEQSPATMIGGGFSGPRPPAFVPAVQEPGF
ncbi:MAG: hypothetical protein ABI193_24770 [Minicystis sp.]